MPQPMNVFALVRWLAGFFLAELVKHAIAIAVSLVIFLPVVFLVTWLALPRLLHGPDVLVWLVTGIFVAIALPLVWFIHRLTSRVDKAFLDRGADPSYCGGVRCFGRSRSATPKT